MKQRTTYLFSLDIQSHVCLLPDLTYAVGVEPSETSHSIGDRRFGNRIWSDSIWKYEIGDFQEQDLSDGWARVNQVCSSLSGGIKRALGLSAANRAFLSIGIISNTLAISVVVPNSIITTAAAHDILLEVTTYLSE